MNVLIVGAGPAGLYLAYLLARQSPQWSLRIVEQNAPDSTFGFGVVLLVMNPIIFRDPTQVPQE